MLAVAVKVEYWFSLAIFVDPNDDSGVSGIAKLVAAAVAASNLVVDRIAEPVPALRPALYPLNH